MLTNKQLKKLEDNGKMIYGVDIDDTLVDYETQNPTGKMWDLIAHFNKAYKQGNYIYIITARKETTKEYTEKQLKDIGMKYHEIIYSKPKCHIIIDDTTVNTLDYMQNPVYYDMRFKRYVDYIIRLARKRGYYK